MSDFNKNLQPIIKDRKNYLLNMPNPSDGNAQPSSYRAGDLGNRELSMFDLLLKGNQEAESNTLYGNPVSFATLEANKRYKAFNPEINDMENFAAYGQSGWEQAGNGVLKGLNLAGTTIAGTFGSIYGVGKAILPGGKLSDIWDNEITRPLDEWNTKVDQEYLPNYYTSRETNADWYETDNWVTTNFLFDKLIKNSGFAVGAMISGNMANSFLLKVGSGVGKLAAAGAEANQTFKLMTPLLKNTSRVFSQGKNIEAHKILEKGIKSIADVDKYSSELLKIQAITNNFSKFSNAARKGIVSTYSALGESSLETLGTGNQFKQQLIEKYKENNFGEEPIGEDLAEINRQTAEVGKYSFFANMALLSATEFTQLPYLMGSTYKNSKRVANDFVGDVVEEGGKFVKVAPKTKFSKLYNTTKRLGTYVFDPKEMGQELGQFAVQVGTQNYYNKANEGDAVDWWVDNVLYGLFGEDERGEGVGALNSKEGIEGGILGGFTGGLMQARGRYTQAKSKAANTDKFLTLINDVPHFGEAFREKLKSANRGTVLQEQEQDAVLSGDELEAKDLKHDAMFNYMFSRIKFGRYDMVIDDIQDYKKNAQTPEGLAELKKQGYANINDTRETYTARLNQMETLAKNINKLYDGINLAYGGEVVVDAEGNIEMDANGNPKKKYSSEVVEKLTYAASKIANYDLRIPQVSNALISADISVMDVLESIINENTSNEDAVDKALQEINKQDINKDELKTALTDVIELSLRRKVFLQEYEDIKKNPLRHTTNKEFAPGDYSNLPVNVKQLQKEEESYRAKQVDKPVQIGKQYSIEDNIKKIGNKFITEPKLTVLSQTLGGELQVKLPDGKITFLTPSEFKQYKLTEADNKSEELNSILEESINDVLELERFKDFKEQFSEMKDVNKIDFVNLMDDKQLSIAIVTEYNKRSKEYFQKKKDQAELQQKLLKYKEQLSKQQEELENNSGSVETPITENIRFEYEKRKEASILFTSGTTESEDKEDPKNSAPHIKRARKFLNTISSHPERGNMKAILVTAEQSERIGLKGLTQMSYKVDENMPLDEIPYEVKDKKIGFVAQVFVIVKNGESYFIDENGDIISKFGEQADINKVVFQTMPTILTHYDNNVPKFREGQKELAKQYSIAYTEFREKLFSQDGLNPDVYFFEISRGIAIERTNAAGEKEKNAVGGILVDENTISTNENLIIIPTNGTIAHNGDLIKFPNGVPVLKNGPTLQALNNKKFNKEESSTIFAVMNAMVEDIIEQIKNNKQVRINRSYSDFLQNIFYWKSKGKETLTPNQISVDFKNMQINIGKKSYEFASFKDNKNEIINNLQQAYNAINNTTLTKEFSKPFTEYIDENLTTREWKNYQTYLLASKTPDGKNRNNIPLTTSVATPSEEFEQFSFKQRYATLENMGLKLPVPVAKKEQSITSKTDDVLKIGEYIIDDKTINTSFILGKDRPIVFTAKPEKDGKFSVTIQSNKTLTDIANDNDKVKNLIIPGIKEKLLPEGVVFPENETNEEYVKFYLGGTLKNILEIERKKEAENRQNVSQETQTIPKEETTTASSSTISEQSTEAKKAEIERRRQEELEFNFGRNIELIASGRTPVIERQSIYSKKYPKGTTLANTDVAQGLVNDYKDINNKYNAELKVLENENIKEQPSNTETYNPNKTKPPKRYRLVGKNNGASKLMSEKDLKTFKEWHTKNVPNIPFEILNNIIEINDTERAWGVFENGVAKFVKGGLSGTEYHEIFEAIYKGMLSVEQQEALINEFKNKKGEFTDRETGKKIKYSEATNLQAKERIADDFSDFRIGKLPARNLGELLRKFFKSIIEFFKSFVSNSTLKEELFKTINTGGFKDKSLSTNVDYSVPDYRKLEGLSEKDSQEFVQDMLARISFILHSKGDKKALYGNITISAKDAFDEIEQEYLEEGKRQQLGDARWEQLKKNTIEALRMFNINYDENNDVSINTEGKNKNEYAAHAFSTDWKKTSTGDMKFSLSTLIETEDVNNENKLTLETPDPKFTTNVKGLKLLNFNRTFSTLLDKLHNTTDKNNFVNKIFNIAKFDGNYVRLLKWIGISNKGHIDFSQFNFEDWRYFVNFYQTFTKQKPEALIQYITEEETYTASAGLFSSSKEVQREWVENIKTLSNSSTSIISFNKQTKKYVVNTEKLKTYSIKTAQNRIDLLNDLGIIFSIDNYNKLKTEKIGNNKSNDQEKFNNAVSAIQNNLGENNDIASVKGKILGINGPLNTLSELYIKVTNPNQENTIYDINGEKRNKYSENNYPSVFQNEFNEANNINEIKEARSELNDVFSKNSQTLKQGGNFINNVGKRIKQITISYIQGTKFLGINKTESIDNMTLGGRFIQEINQNLNGNYFILMPADSSTDQMLNLGNNVLFSDVETGNKAWEKIYSIFTGYLYDDVALAMDADNRDYLQNVGDRKKDLRFFKDILFERELTEINNLLSGEFTTDVEVQNYIKENSENINKAIKEYIEEYYKETKQILIETGEIIKYGENDEFLISKMDSSFMNIEKLDKNSLSEKSVDNIMLFASVNYIIANIEMHKLLFGDPYQFAIKKDGTLDETKRIKSFISPRRTTFDSKEFNTFLNEKYNKAGKIDLLEGEIGHYSFKSHIPTVTFEDVTTVGSLANYMQQFENNNEADAVSLLIDGAYREVKIKNGQWTDDQAEHWHQYQMAYTRRAFEKKGLFSYEDRNELKKHDEQVLSKEEPKYKIEILKPIVTGNKHNKNYFDLILDKTSQVPLYYSMVEGKVLESLYIKMWKEKIGYGIVESGRKMGKEEVHALYINGQFNEAPFNNIINVPWKAFGLQLETSSDVNEEKYQTQGTQLTKGATMNLYENGEPIGDTDVRKQEIKNLVEKNIELLNLMDENNYNEFLNDLGIRDENGTFIRDNGEAVSEKLMYELLRRQASNNAKSALELNEDGQFKIPFEASPNYIQIRNIIYSMIDKTLQSVKMSGGAHVQMPVTGFESLTKGRGLVIKGEDGKWKKINKKQYNALTEEEKKKVVISDDTLKFYEDEEGKRHCEIMLPHWFKNKFGNKTDKEILKYLDTKEGKKILSGIGFRIPTQALSSVEVFVVKGFLPQYMGASVVVPSEITTKAGSDFDIDKLNIYLKSVYVDEKGDVRLIEYKGSEETTKEFYEKVFENKIVSQINKINKISQFKTEILDILNTLETTEIVLSDEQKLFYKNNLDLINIIIEQADSKEILPSEYIEEQLSRLSNKEDELNNKILQDNLKEDFVKQMYKKSLENEYYDSLEQILTLPENFKQLVSPIDDAGLKNVAKELSKLRGETEAGIKNKMLNRNYLTKLRSSFMMGKKWIGLAAVSITNLSLKQKTQTYINPSKFDNLTEEDKKWIGDGTIILPHNTTFVEGIGNVISLSGTTTKEKNKKGEKEYISQRYSGYATSFVDISKDDYITKIIQSDLIASTFMFIENIGVGEKGIFFLNQPIVSEYIKYLDSIKAKGLFNPKHLAPILEKFKASKEEIENTTINLNNLKKNISDYYINKSLTTQQKAEQQKILYEFLKYAKMAEFNFKFTQSTNYDTSSFRSAESLWRKELMTEENEKYNIISSVNNILNNTHIGKKAELINKSVQAVATIFKLDESQFNVILHKVLRPYAQNSYLSGDKFDKIATQIKMSFLDYIIQVKSQRNKLIKKLTVDGEIAETLRKAQENHPQLEILKDLQIVSGEREKGAKSVKLKVNIKEALDEDLYTSYMRELRDFPDTNQLFKDLLTISILQGTYQSSISIRNIIPIEDFADEVTTIINELSANDSSLDTFAKGMFQRNKFKDLEIMPKFHPRFIEMNHDMPIGYQMNSFGDIYEEIYQYKTFLFPDLPELNLSSSDRHVMLLSEQYNSFHLKNDYLVVPRVVTQINANGVEEKIDMVTGQTITKMDYVRMKQKGEQFLYDVYGYAKVKYPDGTPLIKHDEKNGPQHVYKLINLLGDGERVSEHMEYIRPSVINNGSVKTEKEIKDEVLIDIFGTKKEIVTDNSLNLQEQNSSEMNNNVQQTINNETNINEIKENNIVLSIKNKKINKFKNKSIINKIQLNIFEEFNKEQKIYELLKNKIEIENLDFENIPELFILNNLPKLNKDSVEKETGLKVGIKKDINPFWIDNKIGVSVDKAAESFSEFKEQGFANFEDTSYIKDIIIDILVSGNKTEVIEKYTRKNELKEINKELKELNYQENIKEDESWTEEDNNDTCTPF